jgi:choline dehydrogenase-like flavoprotein
MSNAAEYRSRVIADPPEVLDTDVGIIGSGMGGGTLAYALRDSGVEVLLIEQGDFLPRERENWDFGAVHLHKRYKNSDDWHDAVAGKDFQPGNYHYVGGNTKLYGATLPRFREHDFDATEHLDGVSPGWPVSYAELEPFYTQAEHMFWVHGNKGEDPTDPWRSTDYPFPGVRHEGATARLVGAARAQGLQPFAAPQALDYRRGGACVLCHTCDSFPCMVAAKGDAEVCAVRPALSAASGNVRLLTNAAVTRLETDATGRIVTTAHIDHRGRRITIRAKRFVVACGAVNTAALLLRSASEQHPRGLVNSSDQVGRNFMTHLTTFLLGIDPRRKNDAIYQKTFGINDWYAPGPSTKHPLGNIQGLGKIRGSQAKLGRPHTPLPLLNAVTNYSLDLLIQSEDLPLPDSRVTLDSRSMVSLTRRMTNERTHQELSKRTSRLLRKAGFPVVLSRSLGVEATSHQCGTTRMGSNPATSVLDPDLKAHNVENLWIADSSSFPSSAAVNPALTIAALALRLGQSGALTA